MSRKRKRHPCFFHTSLKKDRIKMTQPHTESHLKQSLILLSRLLLGPQDDGDSSSSKMAGLGFDVRDISRQELTTY